MTELRIATRRSPLALWQAEHVAHRLSRLFPDLCVELLPMTTQGDQLLESPLAKIGGKGLFVKELEHALLDGRADIAVHSMKDVPAHFPEGLGLGAILLREDPRDALLGTTSLADLAPGARVGTASLRRQLQLLATRPDLRIGLLRGNVQTRLRKLDDGEFDAIVLAAAGLKRLDMAQRIDAELTAEQMLPAVGQGALGIECRLADAQTQARLSALHHEPSATRLAAERAFAAELGGSCQLPIAGYAELLDDRRLRLRGLIGMPDGSRVVRVEVQGEPRVAQKLGRDLARTARAQGGNEILAELGLA